jgi:hypothetical protein
LRKLLKRGPSISDSSTNLTARVPTEILEQSESVAFDPNQFEELRKSNHDDGFFCSELVAAAYKLVGFLDQSKASSRYLPGKLVNLDVIGSYFLSKEEFEAEERSLSGKRASYLVEERGFLSPCRS